VGQQIIDAAGHWVQQEQPRATVAALVDFLRHAAGDRHQP
jgi:pimeloyl-ACP methyl ester carboxylesterase